MAAENVVTGRRPFLVHEYCNRLGTDGWELVSSEIVPYESDAKGHVTREGKVRFTLSHRRVWRLTFKRITSQDG